MSKLIKNIREQYELYILSLPAFIYIIVFCYVPMSWVQIAFKDFRVRLGVWSSPWVGFVHFQRFFSSNNFWILMRNTLTISIQSMIVMMPLSIVFALMLNEIAVQPFKKTVQMVSYAPYFISTVVLVGMIRIFFAKETGVINKLISMLGGEKLYFLGLTNWFRPLYIGSDVWQGLGYASIIYIAALSAVDLELYESARMDGASKLQKIFYIDIPCILPTIVILVILNLGKVMQVGFEKILLMQNDMNRSVSDVLSTYIYRVGIGGGGSSTGSTMGGDYSYTAAVGLFNNVINLAMVITANTISRKLTQTSLW